MVVEKIKVHIVPAPAPIVFVANNCGEGNPESFSYKTLGMWIPSQEYANGNTITLDGYVRLVFEVVIAAAAAGSSKQPAQAPKVIKPMNIAGRNCMHFFTSRKIKIPAKGWFALN